MARIRSVHPGLFTDEAFMSCSMAARVLVIGLWTEADDQGIFPWKPLTLKARILPVDDVDVPSLLSELCDNGLIFQFTENQKEYGAVRNFRKFQRPKKPNSVHPLPNRIRGFVGLSIPKGETEGPVTSTSSEPVPHQSPTAGGKPPQMEDGGDKVEEVGDKMDGGFVVNNSARDDEAPPDPGLPTDFDRADPHDPHDPQALVGEILPAGPRPESGLTPAQQIVKVFAEVRETHWGRETFPAAGQMIIAQEFVNAKTTLPVEVLVATICTAIVETAQLRHASNPLDVITSLNFFKGPVTRAIAQAEAAERGLDIPDDVRAGAQANGHNGQRPPRQDNFNDDELAKIVADHAAGFI